MKNIICWKQFRILLICCVITTFLVLPYTIALSPNLASILTPTVIVAQVIQATIIFSISIFLGLLLSRKVGLENNINFKKVNYKLSIGLGVLSGVLIILFSFLFSSLSMTFLKAEVGVAPWKGLLASFYGGFAEEIVFRLFLLNLFIWILLKFIKNRNISIWISIILSTMIFGLGHLGITGSITTITAVVIFRAILLNGVSIFFGWLYWKKGLLSAMVAHFSADIIVHVITPIVAALFI